MLRCIYGVMVLDLGLLIIYLTINYLYTVKKYVLLLCFLKLLTNTNMVAQVYAIYNTFVIPQNILDSIDRMGMDDNPILTELEGKYFNAIYQNTRCQTEKKEFDMCGKKVGFFTGNAGSIKIDKKRYFASERLLGINNTECCFGTLYIFDAAQKKESGGYDAAIVSCSSKKINTIKEVVKRLKRKP